MNIKALNNFYLELWNNSGEDFMPLTAYHSSIDKKEREEYLKNKLYSISKLNKKKIRDDAYQEKLFHSARKASQFILNSDEENLNVVFSSEFKSASKEFISSAKSFDKDISFNDISQAARNLWVINCLQVLFGYEVKLSPSAFAYSLLYPYCDNYLDNPLISRSAKSDFNSGLGLRLRGENITPVNDNEEKIYKLISMIEEDFPRDKFPDVYQSLINIHTAQCKSLNLLRTNDLSIDEILQLSFEKGGTSVLTDGYLVGGFLSDLQIKFLYGLGIYLQIIDDLQDYNEDKDAGVSTIFCNNISKNYLDNVTNKTLNFGREIIKQTEYFINGSCFHQLISDSTDLLIIESVCFSNQAYSRAYKETLENFSPFHFSFIKKYRKKYSKKKIPFQELLQTVSIG